MENESYVLSNGRLFADNLCQGIADMIGTEFTPVEGSQTEAVFSTEYKMIAYILFSGSVQGTYTIALDEVTAARMIGAYEEGMALEDLQEMKEDYVGFIKELLNLSVGSSIVELENNFGSLTFSPSTIVYGEVEFPPTIGSNLFLEGANGEGKVQCSFSVTMSQIKIGQKLDEALLELKDKTAEAIESQQNVESILELLPNGLVSINVEGEILPGFSKSTHEVVGCEPDKKIIGLTFSELIAPENDDVISDWDNWRMLVFERFADIPFKDLVELCPFVEIKNTQGKILVLNWLPVVNREDNSLKKLLAVITDVTKEKELEKEAAALAERHNENIELISQVINIEPDEVTTFIYDSFEILNDAQRLLLRDDRSQELINELFRMFHTLKGSSGQYKFTKLQEVAHAAEDHLRSMRDYNIEITQSALNDVSDSIQAAEDHLNKIRDIKLKMGGKEESLRAKTGQSSNVLAVDYESVIAIQSHMNTLLSNLSNDHNFAHKHLESLKEITHGIDKLSEVDMTFFEKSLRSLTKNTSEKLKKHVELSIEENISYNVVVMKKLHKCLVHIINNAIDHGIESPDERKKLGKAEEGNITIKGKRNGIALELVIADDGRGIDLEAVKRKLVEKNKVTKEESEKLSQDELVKYLFIPGFSTKDITTDTSGRGVGMDFVFHTISKLKGEVHVDTRKGVGTAIVISIPNPFEALQAEEAKQKELASAQ